MNYKTERFFAVAETGSCSPDYKRWEERATCGHAHKTREAAEACRVKKQNWSKDGKTCSVLWYNSKIHNQHEGRV